jgi:hypothetical protein
VQPKLPWGNLITCGEGGYPTHGGEKFHEEPILNHEEQELAFYIRHSHPEAAEKPIHEFCCFHGAGWSTGVSKSGNWLDLIASSPLLAAKAPAVRVRITSSK